MGRESDAMMDYLKDNERFADLFNGSFFQGKEVVKAEELSEGSEVYRENFRKWKASESGTKGREEIKITVKEDSVLRTRDVKKRLQSGGSLKVLAVENQNLVNFIMPWRAMDYDALEYGEQIRALRAYNEKEKKLLTPAQRMCGLTQEDRLAPAFTICLYHGKDKWNGPIFRIFIHR